MEHFKKRLRHHSEDDTTAVGTNGKEAGPSEKKEIRTAKKKKNCRSKFRHEDLEIYKLGNNTISTSLCKTKEPYDVCKEKKLQEASETSNEAEKMDRSAAKGKHVLPPVVDPMPERRKKRSVSKKNLEDGNNNKEDTCNPPEKPEGSLDSSSNIRPTIRAKGTEKVAEQPKEDVSSLIEQENPMNLCVKEKTKPEDEIVKERPRIVNVPTTNQYPPPVQRNSPTKPIQKIVPESTDQVTPAVTNVLMRETHETESQHKTNILQEGVIRSVVSLMKDRFLHPFDAESLFILNNWYKYLNSTQNQSESPSVPNVLHETENFVMANLNFFGIARATVPISRMFVQELLMANLDAYKDLLNQLLSTDNRTGEWCNRLYETLTACVQASNPRNKLPANSILNDGNPTIAEPLHSMPNLEVTEQIPQQRPIPKPRNAKPRATRAQANSRDTTSSSASGPRYTSPPHYQQFDKVPPQFNQRMYFPFNCSVPNTENYPNGIPPLAPQQMGMPMVNPALLYGSHSESLAQQLQQQQMLMAMMKQTSRYSYPAGQGMLNPMMDSRPLLVNRANDEQGHPAVNSVPEPHQAMQNLRIPVINIPVSHVAANVQLMQPEHRINYVPHDTNQSMMIHLIEPQKAVPHQATVNRPIQPRQVNAPVSATTQSLSGLGTVHQTDSQHPMNPSLEQLWLVSAPVTATTQSLSGLGTVHQTDSQHPMNPSLEKLRQVSAPASATTQSLSGLGTVHQTDSQHPMNPSLEQRRINEAHNPPTFEPRAMVAQKTIQSAVISEYNVQEATRSKAKPVPVICRPQTSGSMRVSVTNSTEQSKQITQQTNLNPVVAILYIPEVSPDARGAVKRWIDENTPVSGVNQEKLLAMDSGTQQSSYYVPLHDIHHMPVPTTSGISANAQIQHHDSADGVGGNIRVSENGSTTIGGSALRNILISGNSSTTTSTTVSGRSNAGLSSKPCTMTSASITEPTKVSASTSQPTETAQSTEKHHDSADGVGGNIRVSENGSTTIGGSALRIIRISGNSSTTTSTTVSGRSNAGSSSKPCTMTSASITEPTKVSASISQPTETAQSTEKYHKEYGPMRAPNINAISGNCSKPVSTTSTSAIGSLPFVNSINIFGTRASSFQATRANGTNSQTDSDSTLEYQGSRGSQGSSTISPPIFAQDVEEVIQTNVIVDPVKTIGRNNLQSTLPRVITTSNLSTQMNEDLQLTALKQENSQRQMIHTENGSRIKKVAETNNAAEGKGNWSPDRANNSDDLSSSENELRLIKAVLRDQFQDRYSEIVRKVMLAKEEQLKIRNGATDDDIDETISLLSDSTPSMSPKRLSEDELDDTPKRFKSDGFDKGNVDINPELTKSDTKTLKLSLPVIEDISSDDNTTTAGSATNQETDLQFRVGKAGENISPNQALDHAGKAVSSSNMRQQLQIPNLLSPLQNGGLQTSALTSSMPKGPDAPLPDAWQTWLAEERLRGNSLFAPFYGSPQSIETISSAGSDYTPRMNADEFEIRIDSKWYRVKKDIYDRIPKGKLYYEPDRKEFVRYFDDDQIEQFRRNTSDLGHMKASVESNAETFGLPPDPSEVCESFEVDKEVTFSNQDRFSDPVMFVEEMQNVKQYVPKDFYGFYHFVAGYQIVRHHWPITFFMFLLLHNTNRLKKLLYDYVNALMQGLCLH